MRKSKACFCITDHPQKNYLRYMLNPSVVFKICPSLKVSKVHSRIYCPPPLFWNFNLKWGHFKKDKKTCTKLFFKHTEKFFSIVNVCLSSVVWITLNLYNLSLVLVLKKSKKKNHSLNCWDNRCFLFRISNNFKCFYVSWTVFSFENISMYEF